MMNENLSGFVVEALNRTWGDRVDDHMPGLSSTVHADDVGFMAFYSEEFVKWSAIVTANTPLTVELLQQVVDINTHLPIGQVTIRPADSGCLVVWSYKVLSKWIDTDAASSAKLLLDVSYNVDSMVRLCREKLAGVGGDPHVPDDLGVLMFLS